MRIQFYSLNLGRHLNQKEEALCFVLVSAPSCTCRWLWGREKVLVRMTEGLPLLIRADWELVNHRLIPHVRVWCFFFSSLPISWSHCAQIKERLQSRSRKRELKGLLSPSTSPSFLVSRHLFKQPRRAECWAKRRLSGPSCTLFTSLFTLFC